jgi:hypothetical protein
VDGAIVRLVWPSAAECLLCVRFLIILFLLTSNNATFRCCKWLPFRKEQFNFLVVKKFALRRL